MEHQTENDRTSMEHPIVPDLRPGLPYSRISLRFKSTTHEQRFEEEWTQQRMSYDCTTLRFILCALTAGTALQVVLAFCNEGFLTAGSSDSCPEMMITSWIGAVSHLAILMLCGSFYRKHRTLMITLARLYSAISTAAVLPGCAIKSLHKSHRPETFLSATFLRTGIISTWFQAGGFPLPFCIHVPLLVTSVLLHMLVLAPPLCSDQEFLSANGAWIEGVAWFAKQLQSTMYGAIAPPGLILEEEGSGPVSCVRAICFMQASLAAVLPLFIHYCWAARRKFFWYQSLGLSRRPQLGQSLGQQQAPLTEGRCTRADDCYNGGPCGSSYLPPTGLEAFVALTLVAASWVVLGAF